MNFVDSHCHLGRYEDPLSVARRAEEAEVVTVAVTELPSEFQRLSLRLGTQRLVRLALGLHPLRAALASPMELALFARLLDRVEYVGEVGLDRSRDGRSSFPGQIKVFEHLLQQPRIKNKVLTVHSRGAEKETVELLASARATAILHWYSGGLKHIDDALSAGLWFSVNAAMLRSTNGQKIIRALPAERVVTETDGPYASFKRRSSEPSDVPEIVEGLANVWSEDRVGVQQRVFENMCEIAAIARASS
jgi:TatD DNase family protein